MSIGYASVSAEGALPSSNYDIKQSNSYTKKIVAFIYMYVVYYDVVVVVVVVFLQ